MNSFQRICRSPAFLVLALILCAAVIAGGVALDPAAPKVWIVIPVLLAVAAVICFFVARSTSKAALQKKKEAENEGVVKADLDHAGIAANILAALGGKANVQKASCCATRLRFQLKDGAKVDEKALKSAGASGVIRSHGLPGHSWHAGPLCLRRTAKAVVRQRSPSWFRLPEPGFFVIFS